MLVRGFDKEGWAFKPGPVGDLDEIPLHATVDADGDPRQVTAEAWLVRRQIQWLTSLGLSPLLCVKGRDSLQLSCVQSLALAPGGAACSLLGRWGQEGVVKLPRTGMKWPVSVGVSLIAGEASGRVTGELGEAAAMPALAKSGGGESDESSDSSMESGTDDYSSGSDDFSLGDSSSSDESSSSEPVGDFDFGTTSDDSSMPADAESPPADAEMDPELAALLAGSDASSSPSEGDEPAADTDFDQLMKDLEG
jgi:hypothetical protein